MKLRLEGLGIEMVNQLDLAITDLQIMNDDARQTAIGWREIRFVIAFARGVLTSGSKGSTEPALSIFETLFMNPDSSRLTSENVQAQLNRLLSCKFIR